MVPVSRIRGPNPTPVPPQMAPPPKWDPQAEAQAYFAGPHASWAECQRGDWLMAWAESMNLDKRHLVRARCAMARLVVDPDNLDTDQCLLAAEEWAMGKAIWLDGNLRPVTDAPLDLTKIRNHAVTWASMRLAQIAEESEGTFPPDFYRYYAAVSAADSIYVPELPSFSVALAVAGCARAVALEERAQFHDHFDRGGAEYRAMLAKCADAVRDVVVYDSRS